MPRPRQKPRPMPEAPGPDSPRLVMMGDDGEACVDGVCSVPAGPPGAAAAADAVPSHEPERSAPPRGVAH